MTEQTVATSVGIAGSQQSIWRRAEMDVRNVFAHPEHQAQEDSVEMLIVLNSCLPLHHAERVQNNEAIAEARGRGLLKRPSTATRCEGGKYARAC